MKVHFFKKTASLFLSFILIVSMFASINIFEANAMTYLQAEKAMEDFLNVYFNEQKNNFYKFSNNPQNGGTQQNEMDFWISALLWDTINDAYEKTEDPKYNIIISKIYDGLHSGSHPYWDTNTWQENEYNDDLCWWSQASLRTYTLNSEQKYLDLATQMFDKLYTFWDTSFKGGGIWWTQRAASGNQKNVATNANAALIAARLSKVYKTIDPELSAHYLDAANKIYNWTKTNLYRGNGYIIDGVVNNGSANGAENDWNFTYNFGLFAGASYELYSINNDPAYLNDATLSLDWVINNMTSDGCTIMDEGAGDGAGFKLVFMRMMGLIANQGGQSKYMPFIKSNAYQAWIHRRASDGIVGSDLSGTPSNTESILAPSAASAPSLLFLAEFDDNETYETNFTGVYEAENAQRVDVESGVETQGYSGRGHIKWWDNDSAHIKDGYVNFNVNVPKDGIYKIDLRYFSRGDNTRRLSINNGPQFKIFFAADPGNSWLTLSHYAQLKKGDNTIRFTYFNRNNSNRSDNDMDSWFFLDKMTIDLNSSYPLPNEQSYTASGITSNVDYLEGWNGSNNNQYVEFTVKVDVPGKYKLILPYANNSGTSTRELIVNGIAFDNLIQFPKVGPSWNNCSIVEVPGITLNESENKIRISSNTSKNTSEYVNLMNKISIVPDGLNINTKISSLGEKSYFETTLINYQNKEQNCIIAYALYDSDLKLKDLKVVKKAINPFETEIVNTEVFSQLTDSVECTSKVFVFDENNAPLTKLFPYIN